MSDSPSHPRVQDLLEPLGQLDSIVRETVERERELRRQSHIDQTRVREQAEQTLQGLNAAEEDQRAVVEERQAGALGRLDNAYRVRRERIETAHRATKRAMLERIEGLEGQRKYEVQKVMLQAGRDREAAQKQAESTLAERREHLEAEQETLQRFEAKARKVLGAYPVFVSQLSEALREPKPPEDIDADDGSAVIFDAFGREREAAVNAFLSYRKLPLPQLFRGLPASLLILLFGGGAIGLAPLLQMLGQTWYSWPVAIGAGLALTVLIMALHLAGKKQSEAPAQEIIDRLGHARGLLAEAEKVMQREYDQEIERIEFEERSRGTDMDDEWKRAEAEAHRLRATGPSAVEEKFHRILDKHEQRYESRKTNLGPDQKAELDALQNDFVQRRKQLEEETKQKLEAITSATESSLDALGETWHQAVDPIQKAYTALSERSDIDFPSWDDTGFDRWRPPSSFLDRTRFARFKADLDALCGDLPVDRRLQLPEGAQFSIPATLLYPDEGALLIETRDWGREEATTCLNNLVLRVLSNAPAGEVSFTVIDPVGLGQSFSGIAHLADFEEHLLNGRIRTQAQAIEQRLGELNEHMEKVIQMYLRNEYETIAEYNEKAGSIAEKYHFVVVADFPAEFTEIATKRLLSIATSGARCGVYTFIHWDRRKTAPVKHILEDLRKSSLSLVAEGDRFVLHNAPISPLPLELDAPPSPERTVELIRRIGESNLDSNRVEVPFTHVAPPETERWTLDTTRELVVPIGRTGATKLQYLAIGKGTCQHTLIAGKTGSGKSTLFHVIITNLALWADPDQVEFYLVDFKKGVEFKCYATHRLPHARVIAIESDREFGLSVLQKLDDELRRRGDLFRRLGVQDVAGFKKAGGEGPMPRTLLLIDEFQELFVEDDRIAQNANVLLDRIVRQGRAFGIHVILGSQTLGGAYTLARTTMGQMAIRIALQCNEADAYLIMDDSNPAPRLLTRPGEGIYNDAAGMVDGNSPFQTVWLSDDERDEQLAEVARLAQQKDLAGSHPAPVVFEGNAPGDIRDNQPLADLIAGRTEARPARDGARLWLGAPNAIKGPTEARLERQSGNHVLVVGQNDDAIFALLVSSLLSLSAQFAPGQARVLVLSGSTPESPEGSKLASLVDALPLDVQLVKAGEMGDVFHGLQRDMQLAGENDTPDRPPTFVFIHGLQKYKKLRHEEDFSFSLEDDEDAAPDPSKVLDELICEGAGFGFHLIASCDSYNNVGRTLSRKAQTEFELRILFQMSANDSAALIDSAKASSLGLNRALLHNEQEGYTETFRPYALPEPAWIEEACAELAKRHSVAS